MIQFCFQLLISDSKLISHLTFKTHPHPVLLKNRTYITDSHLQIKIILRQIKSKLCSFKINLRLDYNCVFEFEPLVHITRIEGP